MFIHIDLYVCLLDSLNSNFQYFIDLPVKANSVKAVS